MSRKKINLVIFAWCALLLGALKNSVFAQSVLEVKPQVQHSQTQQPLRHLPPSAATPKARLDCIPGVPCHRWGVYFGEVENASCGQDQYGRPVETLTLHTRLPRSSLEETRTAVGTRCHGEAVVGNILLIEGDLTDPIIRIWALSDVTRMYQELKDTPESKEAIGE